MSDLATMSQHLLREMHIDPGTTDANSQVTNDVKIAICESIRFNRRYRFPFNDRWYTFQTIANVDRYDLPHDYIGIVQDSVWSVPSSEFLAKTKLKSMPIQHSNQVQQSSVANVAYRETGSPYGFSIDAGAKKMVILPIPSLTGDTIEYLYVADIGTPVFKYTGSAWAFYEPQDQGSMGNATVTLATTHTSAWFQEAYWLTFYRAAINLFSRAYGGVEGATEKVQMYASMWQEQLNLLRTEAQMGRSVTEIRKHI
jgi:hypothetical protein